MTAAALRVAGLAAVYLLVLTSVAPGDVVIAIGLALTLVLAAGATAARRPRAGWGRWLTGIARMMVATAGEMVIGTVRVMRFCLTGAGQPGFVELPRADRSRHAVALWGVLTGEAPDEYPVVVDDDRHILVVHVIDAGEPRRVRERHAGARERYLRDVVP
jgi:multicomponent Na+:H+ antiporter subunit E